MKKILAFLMVLGFFFTLGNNFASAQGKVLVAYFSYTNHTKNIAEIIAKKTGGDLFRIEPVENYPADDSECRKIASSEKAVKARPEIVGEVENFSEYDTIFIGFPIWYGDAPMPIYTFLEKYDFAGKNIVPFCTHAGSGLSSVDQQFSIIWPTAKILQGFDIHGEIAQKNFDESEKKVSAWLNKIDY